MFPITRCLRCDDLRDQLLIVRTEGEDAAWQCPDCAVKWAPVTFSSALATSGQSRVESIVLPLACPCPARGPFALVRRMSATQDWTWLCAGCGTGQGARFSS